MVEDPDPTSNNNQSKPIHTAPTNSVPPTTPPTTNDSLAPLSDAMISEPHSPYTRSHADPNPPTKANLKAWWNHFTFAQKAKREGDALSAYRSPDNAPHPVFGKPLKESLSHASVQISTANSNGELYVWGYIPVVVAKCGLYLKENATEVPGTFRVNGSSRRMRDLQASFETPPRYGKNLDWKQEQYTTHDVASVFRRYLTQMPEPVIPYDMYHHFRDALAKEPFNQEEVISTYKSLIRKMPRANQYLLLYVLDLLSVFARKSEKNLMTATNLAVIFRPGLISHPQHEMSPQEHALSQRVLEFLIAQQDWFMLDIPPPPNSTVRREGTLGRRDTGQSQSGPSTQPSHGQQVGGSSSSLGHRQTAETSVPAGYVRADTTPTIGVGGVMPRPVMEEPWTGGSGASDVDDIMVIPSSDEEYSQVGGGGWKLVPRALAGDKERIKMMRRRTTIDKHDDPPDRMAFGALSEGDMDDSPTLESSTVQDHGHDVGVGPISVTRSRTLPSRRKDGGEGEEKEPKEKEKARVLKKQRRVSAVLGGQGQQGNWTS
ncbi:hypothetical protein K443DRAFT_80815 [Laccaria amethystina LaAM-08-1]|uniref:Rho-GAP domain-containing protein n=1 Tax=Laccaria amethystina LaAM-08-1 TaxID=1095629 RepID=A0A0C9XYQ9_9AGAR|nr:hypothetical protein K443DRAFT_80815 [Laccaria amethystina LaAM-08-1]